MALWGYMVIGALALTAVILLLRLLTLRRSMKEAAEELREKMSTDTNTLISISSADKNVRRLVSEINVQLRTLRDERRRLQNGDAELKAAVTNISHDLRTPLTAISGYLDLLEQETLPQPAGRYCSVIRERTKALQDLTEELFRYSVITSTADEMIFEAVSLNDVLEESVASFYGALTKAGISPEITMPQQSVVRSVDRTALLRIFSNIIGNAIKYSDGDLQITLQENGTILFSNRAAELNPVQAERLFDRFYTVTSARNSTGLGLSIAKLLTEKMHGSITAEYADGSLRIALRFPQGECEDV